MYVLFCHRLVQSIYVELIVLSRKVVGVFFLNFINIEISTYFWV